MSTLSQELDRYLSIRRSLGYKLATEERILRKFISFAESENAEYISTALFVRWQESFWQGEQADMGAPPWSSSTLCPVASQPASQARSAATSVNPQPRQPATSLHLFRGTNPPDRRICRWTHVN